MGALSFLSRKVGLKKAEEIIASGQVFTAKDMQELHVIDEVVEDGLGMAATRRIIAMRRRRQNTYRAIQRAKQFVQPVQLAELKSVVDVWVDAAMHLETRDLRMMARLVKAQDKLMSVSPEDSAVAALYGEPELLAVNG
jgi:DSF synthase